MCVVCQKYVVFWNDFQRVIRQNIQPRTHIFNENERNVGNANETAYEIVTKNMAS